NRSHLTGAPRAGTDGTVAVNPLQRRIQIVQAKGAFTPKRIRAEILRRSICAEESDLPEARSNSGRRWRRRRRRRRTLSFSPFRRVGGGGGGRSKTTKRMLIEKTATTTGSVADVERIHPI